MFNRNGTARTGVLTLTSLQQNQLIEAKVAMNRYR
jgi:hypothetical protein